MNKWIFTVVLLATAHLALAQSATQQVDKSQFSLLNPTPHSAMRSMATDRPGFTNNPVTVDAGHVQAEFSLFSFAHHSEDGATTNTLQILPGELRVGLLNNVEFQLAFTPYQNVHVKTFGGSSHDEGFGDATQLRLKMNLWGNDGPSKVFGNTAFAIMPYIQIPTATGALTSHHIQGGVSLPLSAKLPAGFKLETMAEFDVVYNGSGYGVNFLHTLNVSHAIPGLKKLSGFIEYAGIAPIRTGSVYQPNASFGLVYQINPNCEIDVDGTLGLSHAADRYTVYAGFSFRR